jgi:hypothetical protein
MSSSRYRHQDSLTWTHRLDVSVFPAFANSGLSQTVRWHAPEAHDSATSHTGPCPQSVLSVSHAAGGLFRVVLQSGGPVPFGRVWHPPSGRCGVDHHSRTGLLGDSLGASLARWALRSPLQDRTAQGHPCRLPLGTWRHGPGCTPGFLGFHTHIAASCAPAKNHLRPASHSGTDCNLQHGDALFLLPKRAAHTPSSLRLLQPRPTTPKTHQIQVAVRYVLYGTSSRPPPVVPAPSSKTAPSALASQAADDAPVISHSGLPGTLLHLQ